MLTYKLRFQPFSGTNAERLAGIETRSKILIKKILLSGLLIFHSLQLYSWEPKDTFVALTYSSKYVWRGLNLVDDSVLQPEVSLSKYDFNLSIWGNVDATDVNGHSWEFSEVDLVLDYSNTFCWIDMQWNYDLGVIYYNYPTGYEPNTWEVFLAVELETCLNPSLVIYYDVDKIKGWYMRYGVRHLWEKVWCYKNSFALGLELSATIGWGSSRFNDFYYSYNRASFVDFVWSVSLPSTWRCWNIEPFFSASYLTNETMQHRVYPFTNYWGGLRLSRYF